MDNYFSFPPVLAPNTTAENIKEYLCIQATAIVVRELASRIYPDKATTMTEHTERLNKLDDVIQNVKKTFMTLQP